MGRGLRNGLRKSLPFNFKPFNITGQKTRWSRSPKKLTESVHGVLLQKAALKGPDPKGVVHLVRPVGDGGCDVSARRIPLHIGGHEMLLSRHDRHIWKRGFVCGGFERDMRGKTCISLTLAHFHPSRLPSLPFFVEKTNSTVKEMNELIYRRCR